jgi:hypothetical protein
MTYQFRSSQTYLQGEKAQHEAADLFRRAGFRVMEYDETSMSSPGYVGDPRGGGLNARWLSAPDLAVAEGFYIEVKAKGRATWTWRMGHRYEHGFPERQYAGYIELGKISGQRVAILVKEEHAPTEGPQDLQGQWPCFLIQWIDRLGVPRVAEMQGEKHVFFPRHLFEPVHIFFQRFKDQHPAPRPTTRRLDGFS